MPGPAGPVRTDRLAPVPQDVAQALDRLQSACAAWPRQDIQPGMAAADGDAPFACDTLQAGPEGAAAILFSAMGFAVALGAVGGVVVGAYSGGLVLKVGGALLGTVAAAIMAKAVGFALVPLPWSGVVFFLLCGAVAGWFAIGPFCRRVDAWERQDQGAAS